MARLDYYFRETVTGLRRNGLVVFAAIASIAATALLTLVLYRMNASADGASQRKQGGGEAGGDGGGD